MPCPTLATISGAASMTVASVLDSSGADTTDALARTSLQTKLMSYASVISIVRQLPVRCGQARFLMPISLILVPSFSASDAPVKDAAVRLRYFLQGRAVGAVLDASRAQKCVQRASRSIMQRGQGESPPERSKRPLIVAAPSRVFFPMRARPCTVPLPASV